MMKNSVWVSQARRAGSGEESPLCSPAGAGQVSRGVEGAAQSRAGSPRPAASRCVLTAHFSKPGSWPAGAPAVPPSGPSRTRPRDF